MEIRVEQSEVDQSVNYVFSSGKDLYSLGETTVNHCLLSYCNFGLSLTASEVADRLGVGVQLVRELMKVLDVKKSSSFEDVLSSKLAFEKGFLDKAASKDAVIERLMRENAQLSSQVKAASAVRHDSFMLDSDYKVPEFIADEYALYRRTRETTGKDYDQKSVVIAISDLHVGLIVREEETITGNKYNFAVFKERFDEITSGILRSHHVFHGADKIFVTLLGDLFEGVLGNMREGHMREVELYGMDQIRFAVKYICEFIATLAKMHSDKKIIVNYVSGNHDRVGRSKEDDQTRIFMQTAWSFVEFALGGYNNIELQDAHAKRWFGFYVTDSCRMVVQHGDMNNKVDNMFKIDSVHPALFRIFLKGHFHTKRVIEGNNYLEITTTSTVGGSFYSENQLALAGVPSQLVLEITERKGDLFPIKVKTHWYDASN